MAATPKKSTRWEARQLGARYGDDPEILGTYDGANAEALGRARALTEAVRLQPRSPKVVLVRVETLEYTESEYTAETAAAFLTPEKIEQGPAPSDEPFRGGL